MRSTRTLLLVALLTSTAAHAQPGAAEAPGSDGERPDSTLVGSPAVPRREQTLVHKLTSSARIAARDGHCRTIAIIGTRVRAIDASYHRDVFATDAEIAGCVEGLSRRPPTLDVSRDDDEVARPAPALSTTTAPRDYTSPRVALALSLGTTLSSVAFYIAADVNYQHAAPLALAGTFALALGPTTGHIYAGDTWNAGLKVRLGGLGAAVAGFTLAITACPPFGGGCSNEGLATLGALTFVGGGITYGIGTLYEIATAPAAARASNRARARRFAVGPVVGHTPGLAVAGMF